MKLEKLGPYRIVKQIGKGGMGAVYEAFCEDSNSPAATRVAIKALSPQLAMAEGFRERFEAEIESLKKLKHDGIVRLLGYGEQDGVLFYSMELVNGPSLEEEISRGRRFSWRETLQIGIQICRALKHAHDHGVVHRDIKPANLMLSQGDRIKIADFGIARLFGGTQLTTAGGVLGTADYMSPEQADGRAVTEKCDQYSLGGVMYALLAGRPPFRAKTMPEMLQLQRFAAAEPVRRYAPDTPDQLDRLISQLLSKSPGDRFPNVLVLSRHMEAMEKAFSRPGKSGPEPATSDGRNGNLSPTPSAPATAVGNEARTLGADEPIILPQETLQGTSHPDLYEAATLDQPTDFKESTSQSISLVIPASKATEAPPAKKSTHFTTVDEDARRQQELNRGNRLVLVVQLVSLAAALSLLAWGGWYLMKPATADELFATIQQEANAESLAPVSRDVEQALESFFSRFPNDPRIEQLRPMQERMEFLAYERQARLRSKFSSDRALPPIERIYADAMSIAEDQPAQALAALQALLDLYDPTGLVVDTETANAMAKQFQDLGDPRLLVIARQRSLALSEQVHTLSASQLPALRERLGYAQQIQETNPVRAQRMYRAIVRLYQDQPWAHEVVRLSELALERMSNEP